jgi:hypothetical protein
MQKIFLTITILFMSIFAVADDKSNIASNVKDAVMQKEVPQEHKDIANKILEERKNLSEHIQNELEKFSANFNNPDKKANKNLYKSLSAETKQILKKERILKKNLSKEGKKNVNMIISKFTATKAENKK